MPALRGVPITGVILTLLAILADSKHYWTHDFIAVENDNQTPDVVETNFTKIRLGRGLYAMGGNMNLKQDLTDDLILKSELFISRTGSNNYVRTPFRIPECKLSDFMNTYYKDLFMETMGNCSKNSPQFENKLEMPLTKRNIILHSCLLYMDNMPSYMTPGYYRLVVHYKNQANGSFTLLALIEPDN